MRQLLPPDGAGPHVDVAAMYGAAAARPAPPDRPWIALDMVTSVDGATAADGRSGGLSSPDDKAVFHALRAASDAILVGAGTVRVERYGPPRLSDEERARRTAEGRAERPRLAIVSGRLDLDPALRAFTQAAEPPILLTRTDVAPEARAALEPLAEIVEVGKGAVDLRAGMRALHDRAIRFVVCEGGPVLNAGLAAADLIDEICLTISPMLAGGDSDRIIAPVAPLAVDLELTHVLEADGSLFLRYARAPA